MGHDPSEIFKVLGVDSRLRIIHLLKHHGPMGAKAIAERMNVTTAAVSQHLKALKQAGIVHSERQGFHIPYSLSEEGLDHCHRMATEVCSCGCPGHGKGGRKNDLSALKQYRDELQNAIKRVEAKIKKLESK